MDSRGAAVEQVHLDRGASSRSDLPIAHGEGKFVPADDDVRRRLWDNDQVALVYVKPDDTTPNGEFPVQSQRQHGRYRRRV